MADIKEDNEIYNDKINLNNNQKEQLTKSAAEIVADMKLKSLNQEFAQNAAMQASDKVVRAAAENAAKTEVELSRINADSNVSGKSNLLNSVDNKLYGNKVENVKGNGAKIRNVAKNTAKNATINTIKNLSETSGIDDSFGQGDGIQDVINTNKKVMNTAMNAGKMGFDSAKTAGKMAGKAMNNAKSALSGNNGMPNTNLGEQVTNKRFQIC